MDLPFTLFVIFLMSGYLFASFGLLFSSSSLLAWVFAHIVFISLACLMLEYKACYHILLFPYMRRNEVKLKPEILLPLSVLFVNIKLPCVLVAPTDATWFNLLTHTASKCILHLSLLPHIGFYSCSLVMLHCHPFCVKSDS